MVKRMFDVAIRNMISRMLVIGTMYIRMNAPKMDMKMCVLRSFRLRNDGSFQERRHKNTNESRSKNTQKTVAVTSSVPKMKCGILMVATILFSPQ